MSDQLFEKILAPILNIYFNVDSLESLEKGIIKERIETIGNMQIIIYSNDHNPPHFHVKSKDNKTNAKFKIENCEFISGEIESKDIRRIAAFYNDIKVKIVKDKMMDIWNKKNNLP